MERGRTLNNRNTTVHQLVYAAGRSRAPESHRHTSFRRQTQLLLLNRSFRHLKLAHPAVETIYTMKVPIRSIKAK